MLKKALSLVILVAGVQVSFGQTTFLPLRSEDYHVLDRLETLSGKFCDSLANGDKPESRRNAVNFLETIKAKNEPGKVKPGADGKSVIVDKLSKIDRYNLEQMISESGEWAPDESETINSKRAWFRTFYKKQYDFGYVKPDGFFLDKNFFVVANPVASGMAVMQRNEPSPGGSIKNTLFINSQGAELRGWIAKKIGFYTSITDNQEQYPYYVSNMVTKRFQAVPGADYFLKPSKPTGRYDYMQASGYINFDAVKNHVNVTFGMGKHFIGDGTTSLFLTDNSSNMPFLRIQTRIWHINYECLYMELTPQYLKGFDAILNHKYSTIHYLTWNISKRFSLGLFESEVFSRPNAYELSYLNPIIFTTAINRFNGSGDKSILGMSAKAIVARHLQFYGQLIFNEFRVKELTGGNGWYGNKWGIQAGGKYFDAFTVKNLDLQAEINVVRPYTYASQDTLANYTNYNQPLADPLGSGFIKTTGIIRYQPVRNLYLSLKGTYYMQGVDTGNSNFGNDVFKNYLTADHIYGVSMINGPKSNCAIISMNLSYQLRRNLFIDMGGVYRKYDVGVSNGSTTTGPVYGPLTTTFVYFGLRINTARREYDFF